MLRTWMRWAVIGLAVMVLAIQLVPYGRDHTNPPVRKEPSWDTPQTRELTERACGDCHSNQTVWPWYSNIAPVSWLVQRDVDVGRRKLNYSEWDRRQEEATESADTVRKGTMPPWYYPWARLSPPERQALIRGLAATFGRK
jgi:mono/diheme cytochrome c family protein